MVGENLRIKFLVLVFNSAFVSLSLCTTKAVLSGQPLLFITYRRLEIESYTQLECVDLVLSRGVTQHLAALE